MTFGTLRREALAEPSQRGEILARGRRSGWVDALRVCLDCLDEREKALADFSAALLQVFGRADPFGKEITRRLSQLLREILERGIDRREETGVIMCRNLLDRVRSRSRSSGYFLAKGRRQTRFGEVVRGILARRWRGSGPRGTGETATSEVGTFEETANGPDNAGGDCGSGRTATGRLAVSLAEPSRERRIWLRQSASHCFRAWETCSKLFRLVTVLGCSAPSVFARISYTLRRIGSAS